MEPTQPIQQYGSFLSLKHNKKEDLETTINSLSNKALSLLCALYYSNENYDLDSYTYENMLELFSQGLLVMDETNVKIPDHVRKALPSLIIYSEDFNTDPMDLDSSSDPDEASSGGIISSGG